MPLSPINKYEMLYRYYEWLNTEEGENGFVPKVEEPGLGRRLRALRNLGQRERAGRGEERVLKALGCTMVDRKIAEPAWQGGQGRGPDGRKIDIWNRDKWDNVWSVLHRELTDTWSSIPEIKRHDTQPLPDFESLRWPLPTPPVASAAVEAAALLPDELLYSLASSRTGLQNIPPEEWNLRQNEDLRDTLTSKYQDAFPIVLDDISNHSRESRTGDPVQRESENWTTNTEDVENSRTAQAAGLRPADLADMESFIDYSGGRPHSPPSLNYPNSSVAENPKRL